MKYIKGSGHQRELEYSEAFDRAREPNDQISLEECISAELFDRYDDLDEHSAARWIIAQVTNDMFIDIDGNEPEVHMGDVLDLIEDLEQYMVSWQNDLEDQDRPNEEETAQAGRDALILVLSHLRPDWAVQVQPVV